MGLENIAYGRLFARIAEAYLNVLSRKVEPFGLDRYFGALLYIVENSGKITQKQLGRHLSKDKVSVLRCVNYLMAQGLVLKKMNQQDKRESILAASEKSKKLAPIISEAIRDTNNVLFNNFQKKEFKEFETGLKKLLTVVDKMPDPDFIIRAEKKKNLVFER
jgi:DNA-binding MarR family transcriptional regulator